MKQQKKVHRIFIEFDLNDNCFECPSEISHRIINVLRIKDSDELIVFNSKREQYLCRISIINKNVVIRLKEKILNQNESSKIVRLYVSVINMKLMDLVVQKSVELGATDLYPIYTLRSQYKNVEKKIEHWKKIAIHATEQCGRLRLMHIHSPRTYSSLISKQISSSKFLLHQDGEKFNTSELESDDISIFVGPEGGFDSSEIESFKINGWKMRTINVNILRTETACISALSLINNYDIFSRHSL